MSATTELKKLSDRILEMSESATIGMAQKAREFAAKGIDVIKLSLGEPDFKTPEHICEAAKKAIDDGFHGYSPVSGYPDLKEAIITKFKRDNNLDYNPENIVVSTGAKQSLANILLCLLDEGDEVVIYAPYWVSYSELVKLAGGKPVLINGSVEQNFKAPIESLKAAITDKTKVIMFSSPCNPTGSAFTKEELKEIADEVASHENLYVISDEIYEYINFGDQHASIAQFENVKERVAIVNGLSKGFAMTGWRLGYMAAPAWLAKACDKLQGQVTSGTNSVTQKAAVAALTGDLTPTEEMRKAFLRRRDLVHGLLGEIPGVKTTLPTGAFYFFPDVSAYFGKSFEGEKIANATDLSLFLLKDAHVATVTGEAFGSPNNIRLSFAASDDELKEALKRIKESLAKLS